MNEEDKRIIDATIQEFLDQMELRFGEKFKLEPPRFVSEEVAREMLNCGKTQLYHLRTKLKISFVQDEDHPKMILYDRLSILEYCEKNLKKAW